MNLDKIMDFFGLNNNVREDNIESTKKVVSINKNKDMKLNFYQPESYTEVKEIADKIKNGKAIIINLENLEVDTARRFVDFISGAVYALNGRVIKAGKGVFVFTPGSISIEGKDLSEAVKDNFLDD